VTISPLRLPLDVLYNKLTKYFAFEWSKRSPNWLVHPELNVVVKKHFISVSDTVLRCHQTIPIEEVRFMCIPLNLVDRISKLDALDASIYCHLPCLLLHAQIPSQTSTTLLQNFHHVTTNSVRAGASSSAIRQLIYRSFQNRIALPSPMTALAMP
jgi:hypothetical protein